VFDLARSASEALSGKTVVPATAPVEDAAFSAVGKPPRSGESSLCRDLTGVCGFSSGIVVVPSKFALAGFATGTIASGAFSCEALGFVLIAVTYVTLNLFCGFLWNGSHRHVSGVLTRDVP
jgi:hypothetical protein